jgi:hypothetical protein
MNVIGFIKSWHFHKIPNCSQKQLKEDFRDYPPKPLKSTADGVGFDVVFVSRVGATIHKFAAVVRILKSDDSGLDVENSELAGFKDLKINAHKFTQSIVDLNKVFKSINLPGKIAFGCLSVLFVPFVLVGVIVLLAYLIIILRRLYKETRRKYGYFLPIPKSDREIVVNRQSSLNQGIDFLSIISHEHIHLLQHVNKSKIDAARGAKIGIRDPLILMHEDVCGYKHLIYTLERNELEARLHEVVLSYYREFGHIPLTIDGFISLLCDCRELGEFITEAISETDGHFFLGTIASLILLEKRRLPMT